MSETGTRTERRKARTRRALLDAARRLIARTGTTDSSIKEITDEADVGFGTFFNHFASKDELFREAINEVLDGFGAQLDASCEGIDDWATRYAIGVRMTARLAINQPSVARVLFAFGDTYLLSDKGLAPRALRDIENATATGRFHVKNTQVALVSTAGCVLAFVRMALDYPGRLTAEDADELAELLLRTLGMSTRSAASIAHRPLPAIPRREHPPGS
jgi:AcrR family transcriptional regulator